MQASFWTARSIFWTLNEQLEINSCLMRVFAVSDVGEVEVCILICVLLFAFVDLVCFGFLVFLGCRRRLFLLL